jgi:hypothetical protein
LFDRVRIDGRSFHIMAGDADDRRLLPHAVNGTGELVLSDSS